MKTQLLEDIGQSANVGFTPAKTAGNPSARKEAGQAALAGDAPAAQSRSAPGVWRHKPAAEAPGDAAQQTARQTVQAPAPLPEESTAQELDRLVEELAALEAQLVPPGERQEPALAPAGPEPELRIPPVQSPRQPAIAPSEASHAPGPVRSAAAPREPSFDYAPPLPARQAAEPFVAEPFVAEPLAAAPLAVDPHMAEPFMPAAAGARRSAPRYLAWAACLLAVVLLVLGGRWWYQERRDTGALARIAGAAKEVVPRGDQDVSQPALAAKESTPGPGADAAAPPATSASRPSPGVPPLVMLKDVAPAAVEREQPVAPVASREPPAMAPAPEPVVEKVPAAPAPKASPATPHERSAAGAAAVPAKEKRDREPVRQVARASGAAKERPSEPDNSLEATLKACRELGYHATQCIKQGCGMTAYGLVCRGR